MIRRAGVVDDTILLITALLITSLLGLAAIQNVQGGSDLVRAESVGIMSERISSTAYSMDAFDNMMVGLEMERENYRVFEQEETNYIEFEHTLSDNDVEIRDPYNVEIEIVDNPEKGIEAARDGGLTDELCLIKREGNKVELMPGGCTDR